MISLLETFYNQVDARILVSNILDSVDSVYSRVMKCILYTLSCYIIVLHLIRQNICQIEADHFHPRMRTCTITNVLKL